MDVIKIVILGIVGTFMVLMLKEPKPQIALAVTIATASTLFFMLLSGLWYVVDVVKITADKINLNPEYIAAIFRMTGVAYLAQFGADVCRDAGQTAIASKIELAGKVSIVVLSIPILLALFNMLIGLLP